MAIIQQGVFINGSVQTDELDDGSQTLFGNKTNKPIGGRRKGKPPHVNIIVVAISSVGILLNSLVVFTTLRNKSLRNSTFICLTSLALVDILFLTFSVVNFTKSSLRGGFAEAVIILLDCLQDFSRLCSALHLVLLSGIRFYKLGFPLKALVKITTRRTILLCGLTWLASAVIATGNVLIMKFYLSDDSINSVAYHYDALIVYYLLPLSMLIIFHSLKLEWLRRSRLNWGTSNKVARHMLLMVILVILIFLIFNLPIALRSFLIVHKIRNPILGEMASYCILLNSTLNPALYWVMSKQFRSGLVKAVFCCASRKLVRGDTRICTITASMTETEMTPNLSSLRPNTNQGECIDSRSCRPNEADQNKKCYDIGLAD